jgi:Mrp family chromosome partitioning ATPase
MSDLLGVPIASQPSEISALGMTKTVGFLRQKEIPTIGVVTMMDGYLCRDCRKTSHQLILPSSARELHQMDYRSTFQRPETALLLWNLAWSVVGVPISKLEPARGFEPTTPGSED